MRHPVCVYYCTTQLVGVVNSKRINISRTFRIESVYQELLVRINENDSPAAMVTTVMFGGN